MTPEEAKNILQVCRPDRPEDRADPIIAEALKMAEQDSELGAWFAGQQAFDRKVSSQVNAIEAPEDLKATILAGMRMHAQDTETAAPDTSAPSSTSSVWWRSPWIGIAAVFAFMLVFIAIPRGVDPHLAAVDPSGPDADAPEILRYLASQIDQIKAYSFDKRDSNPRQLQSYLASAGAPTCNVMAEKLKNEESIGCLVLEYNGTKMSLVCFKDDLVYHLTTADQAGFPINVSAEPQIYELKDQTFKLWTEESKVQILSVHGEKKDLPEII